MEPINLDERLFLTVREFAELYQSDPRTVRRGIAAGDIPAVRISGCVRIPVPAVRELLGLPAISAVGAATA